MLTCGVPTGLGETAVVVTDVVVSADESVVLDAFAAVCNENRPQGHKNVFRGL
jgi:hypothetical protein